MEKFENMQQNKIVDEELDQITGGISLFDIFTAEFRGSRNNPATLELHPDEEADFNAATLEMRANPIEQEKNNRKVIKL